jgi:hypothetical protein
MQALGAGFFYVLKVVFCRKAGGWNRNVIMAILCFVTVALYGLSHKIYRHVKARGVHLAFTSTRPPRDKNDLRLFEPDRSFFVIKTFFVFVFLR